MQKGKDKVVEQKDIWFLDSVEIDISKTYFDPDKIKDTTITFNSNSTHSNKIIYLTTVNPDQKLTNISNIKLHNVKLDTVPKIYIINGIPITDTTGVKIMPSAIKDLKIIKNSEDEGYKFHRTPVIVYRIETKTITKQKSK